MRLWVRKRMVGTGSRKGAPVAMKSLRGKPTGLLYIPSVLCQKLEAELVVVDDTKRRYIVAHGFGKYIQELATYPADVLYQLFEINGRAPIKVKDYNRLKRQGALTACPFVLECLRAAGKVEEAP